MELVTREPEDPEWQLEILKSVIESRSVSFSTMATVFVVMAVFFLGAAATGKMTGFQYDVVFGFFLFGAFFFLVDFWRDLKVKKKLILLAEGKAIPIEEFKRFLKDIPL